MAKIGGWFGKFLNVLFGILKVGKDNELFEKGNVPHIETKERKLP